MHSIARSSQRTATAVLAANRRGGGAARRTKARTTKWPVGWATKSVGSSKGNSATHPWNRTWHPSASVPTTHVGLAVVAARCIAGASGLDGGVLVGVVNRCHTRHKYRLREQHDLPDLTTTSLRTPSLFTGEHSKSYQVHPMYISLPSSTGRFQNGWLCFSIVSLWSVAQVHQEPNRLRGIPMPSRLPWCTMLSWPLGAAWQKSSVTSVTILFCVTTIWEERVVNADLYEKVSFESL